MPWRPKGSGRARGHPGDGGVRPEMGPDLGSGAEPREKKMTSMSQFEAKFLYPTTYRTSFCSSHQALQSQNNQHGGCCARVEQGEFLGEF